MEEMDVVALKQMQKNMDSNMDFRTSFGQYVNRDQLLEIFGGGGMIQVRWGIPAGQDAYPRTAVIEVRHPDQVPEPEPKPAVKSDIGETPRQRVKREDKEHAYALGIDEIRDLVYDSVVEAADGCQVDPDGGYPHGHQSPLLVLGMI